MQYKNELIRLLNNYETDARKLQIRIDDINSNSNLSDSGKAYELAKVNADHQALEQINLTLFDAVFDNAINNQSRIITNRLENQSYQVRLNNALTILKATGEDLEDHELNLIIQPFIEDEIAKKAILRTLQADRPGFQHEQLKTSGGVQKSIEMIKRMQENVHNMLNPNHLWSGLEGRAIRIEGIREGLNSMTISSIGLDQHNFN